MSLRTGEGGRIEGQKTQSAIHTTANTTRTPVPERYNSQHRTQKKEEETQKRTRYVVTANKITRPSIPNTKAETKTMTILPMNSAVAARRVDLNIYILRTRTHTEACFSHIIL
jgi:hypothetical protein